MRTSLQLKQSIIQEEVFSPVKANVRNWERLGQKMLPHKIIVKIARTNICEENFEAVELLVIAHKCGPKVDVTSLKSVKKKSQKSCHSAAAGFGPKVGFVTFMQFAREENPWQAEF